MQELLTEALAAEWTPEQAAVLEQTEGAESVVDAVQRVASKVPQVRHHAVSAAILHLCSALPGFFVSTHDWNAAKLLANRVICTATQHVRKTC